MSHNVSPCLTGENSLSPSQLGDPEISPIDREILTDRQRLALELILAGKTDVQVAQSVGVARRTICRWRHTDANFIAELRRRRKVMWDGVSDRLRSLLEPAVEVLPEQLTNPYDRSRFRAATTLLRLVNVKAMLAVRQEDEPEQGT